MQEASSEARIDDAFGDVRRAGRATPLGCIDQVSRRAARHHWYEIARAAEPVSFDTSFHSSGIRLRVDFSSEVEAIAFATAFDAKISAY